MLIRTSVIRLQDPKNGSLCIRNCLWLPFSGQAADSPRDAFTATEQKGARGGLVAAATLQKESQQAGAGGTQWPTRQWTCVTYPCVGIRHAHDESGWAASTGPRTTQAINKGERRKVTNLGEMPWFLTLEKTSIKNSQTWDVGQGTLKTLMVPAQVWGHMGIHACTRSPRIRPPDTRGF